MSTIASISTTPIQALPLHLEERECQAYTEMTAFLTPAQLEEVRRKFHSIPDIRKQAQFLLEAYTLRYWDDAIYQNPDFPYVALYALKIGILPIDGFISIQLFWKTSQDSARIETIRQDLRNLIKQTLHLVPRFSDDRGMLKTLRGPIQNSTGGMRSPADFLNHNITDEDVTKIIESIYLLTDEQIDRMLTEVPFSEQVVWIVDCPEEYSFKDRITKAGLNFFMKIPGGKIMVPSYGLWKNFIRIKFGADAVQIVPALNLTPYEARVEASKKDWRHFLVPHPIIKAPAEADGVPVWGIDFQRHDLMYHIYNISSIPKPLRRLSNIAADIVKKLSSQFSLNDREGFEIMEDILLDIDFDSREEYGDYFGTPGDQFWAFLCGVIEISRYGKDMSPLAVETVITELAQTLPATAEIRPGPRAAYLRMLRKIDDEERRVHFRKNHPLKLMTDLWEKR